MPLPTSSNQQSLRKRDDALRRAAALFEERILPHLSPRGCALDLGTGNGHTAFTLAKHFSSVASIDIDAACVSRAQDKAETLNLPNVHLQVMDAHSLHYPDDHFDAVTCRAAIHHYKDPILVLQEVRRVLKTGAPFVVMDFCFSPAAKAALTTISKIRETDFARYFTFHEYCEILESNGFDIDTVYTYTLPRILTEWVAVAPGNVQDRLIDAFLALPSEVHAELHLTSCADGYVMTYRIVEFLVRKQHTLVP